MRIALKIQAASGEKKEVQLPYVSELGDAILVEHGPAERPFLKGERIHLSTQTFAEVGWTVHLLAQ